MHSNTDRIFQGASTFPGQEEWFYRTREGIAGPYLNRDDAALALRRFIQYCKDNQLVGGRVEVPVIPAPAPVPAVPAVKVDTGVGLVKALARLAPEALAVCVEAALATGRQQIASHGRSGRVLKQRFKKAF
jgi:hypothetical protein